MSRRDLNGKAILITGAARGIGEHTARALARRGARLALAGLEPDRLERLAGELGAAWFEADVTDQEAVDRAVEGAVAALGGIDVVVANAGVANNNTVAVSPVDVIVRTIDVNLIGVVRTVSAALPHVIDRRGYVCIVASAASFTALPGMAAYCASKAGVEAFGNALRFEVAHKGVRVGTVHPSWIDTDLVRDQKAESETFSEMLGSLPWPMGQTTSVDECVAAIVDGIERRRRKVFVPRPVGAVSALRSFVLGPVGSLAVQLGARRAVPKLEAEAARAQWFGRSSTGLGARDPQVAAGHEERAIAAGHEERVIAP
jgi:NAD(P)-dependent dehydrogenase (short-subunit alcohol dehydrogenase family)